MADCGGTSLKFSELRAAHGMSEQRQKGKYSSNKYPPTTHMYDADSQMIIGSLIPEGIQLINVVKSASETENLTVSSVLPLVAAEDVLTNSEFIKKYNIKVSYNESEQLGVGTVVMDIQKIMVKIPYADGESLVVMSSTMDISKPKVVVKTIESVDLSVSTTLLDIVIN